MNDLYARQAELQVERARIVEELHTIAKEIHVLEAKDWLERQGLTESAILAIQGVSNNSKVGIPGA